MTNKATSCHYRKYFTTGAQTAQYLADQPVFTSQ